MDALKVESMGVRNFCTRRRNLFDHGKVSLARYRVAAITLGEGDDADRQRRPTDDIRRRRPARPAPRRPSRTSSDEPPPMSRQNHARGVRIEQLRAAGRRSRASVAESTISISSPA